MKKMTLVTLLLTGLYLWPQLVKAETLVIPGTGASETLLKKLAVSFNRKTPEHNVEIPPSVGSNGVLIHY